MSQSKLQVNNHEVKPAKKVKLYERIGARGVKKILSEDGGAEVLAALKEELSKKQEANLKQELAAGSVQ